MRRRGRIRSHLAVGLALAVAASVPAGSRADEQALRVLDINRGSRLTFPDLFTAAGSKVFFRAENGVHGGELWASEFPTGIASLVMEIAPGGQSSDPRDLTALGETLLFSADDLEHDRELWRSDGTEPGTMLVKDIRPGLAGSDAESMTRLGNEVFFVADDGDHGMELWRTDGSAGGTTLVKDIRPGLPGSEPLELASVGEYLYFSAEDGTSGRELWRSDGTPEGTLLVADIKPGPAGSEPAGITDFGGIAFFAADGDAALDFEIETLRGPTTELWRSDGSAAGTFLVKDIQPGPLGSNPDFLTVANQALFFGANDGIHGKELWRTDGSAAGTAMVKDIGPGSWSGSPAALTPGGDVLYFSAGANSLNDPQLWRSDGTDLGTTRVKAFAFGDPVTRCGCGPDELTFTGGRLYFSLWSYPDPSGGLWTSDGTEQGTNPVGTTRGAAGGLAGVRGRLYFALDDASGNDGSGFDPWTSDGSDESTLRLEVNETGFDPTSDSDPTNLTDAQGRLFFTADDGVHGNELWTSNGTEPGTELVKDIWPGPQDPESLSVGSAHPRDMVSLGGTLLFSADHGVHGRELWRSDGTEDGTVLVKDINPGNTDSIDDIDGASPTVAGNRIFFVADDGQHGRELWMSDGTEAGTVMVRNIRSDSSGVLDQPQGSYPERLTAVGDAVYFVADDGSHGLELWHSDGTEAGTTLVKDLIPGHSLFGFEMALLDDVLLFSANLQLWRTDGTAEGTTLVKDIDAYRLTRFDDGVLFMADDRVHGYELWRTDGTEAGTMLLKDIRPGEASSDPFALTAAEHTLFFTADDGQGVGLWKTDGTESGTVLVKVDEGEGPAGLGGLTPVGQVLWFVASDAEHGLELWRSNGTPGGTSRAADIFPGPDSSVPRYLTSSGDRLFLRANDGVAGTELFALSLN